MNNSASLRGKNTQAAREANREAIVSFFRSGITDHSGAVGIELEHTIIKSKEASAVSYSEEHGVCWLLEQLMEWYPEAIRDAEGDLLGVSRPREAITIEPASQLELSAGPFDSLADAYRCFNEFEERLASILGPVGHTALTIGYHPTASAIDLELIPKRRYQFMNLYLGSLSPWGPRMMRGSASTQVSIDYSSESDCLRKLRLAFALTPLLSLVTDNAPYFEGKPRPHQLMRTEIWQKCDSDRCGIIPGALDPSFTLYDLADHVLDTPAILTPCDRREWCYSDKSFGELYANTPMQRSDVEHALSMQFTDARVKTYLEIRPADAIPVPYVIAYAALIKGLFANEHTLSRLDGLFEGVTEEDIDAAKSALMAKGYQADVYGRAVATLADEAANIAYTGLDESEQVFLHPLAELIERRETLAELAEKKGSHA